MEQSSKSTAKSKGPRVLANTVKKPEKSLNTSGNRSFLKKSSHHYIQDLRMNNAKLAHSVAAERSRYAELYKRYIENEKFFVSQQTEFRTITHNIRIGVRSLNDSVELMCTGISILSDVNDKLNNLWPEPKEKALPQISLANLNSPCTSNRPTMSGVVDNNRSPVPQTVKSQTVFSPRADMPPPRQCAAMPMVKGQVISKPTISLQRVDMPVNVTINAPANMAVNAPENAPVNVAVNSSENAPVNVAVNAPENAPVGFRKKNRPPLRPTKGTFVQNIVNLNRLSVVSEEMNNSGDYSANTSQMSLSPNRHSTNYSEPGSNSLPASHVVLERIDADLMLPSNNMAPESVEDHDQLTMVHFGNFGYESTVTIMKQPSPEKVSLKVKQNLSPSPGTPKGNSNSTDSDEYETDSSSEDEDLALQIVESKKSYTERKRQLDSKEGTSWNYDDTGKYRGRPPKVKKLFAKHSNSGGTSSSLAKPKDRLLKDKVSSPRELRVMEKLTSPKSHTKDPTCSNQSALSELGECLRSPGDNVADHMNSTSLDLMSMSFTCVTDTRMPFVLDCNNSEVSPERAQGSLEFSEQNQNSERKVFVTQRSRGRKPPPDNSKSPNLNRSTLSPPSSYRRGLSFVENNENSPPSPVLADKEELVGTWSSISEDLSHLPNVVLERLPSNIISGNTYLPDNPDLPAHKLPKSPDTHSTHSKARFKCVLTVSETSTRERNVTGLPDESKIVEKKEDVKKARPNEKRKLFTPSVSPKVPRIDSNSPDTNSVANQYTSSKSLPSREGSSISPNRKVKQREVEEHVSNAPKPKKRSAKSQKSLAEIHVGDSLSSPNELHGHLEKGPSEAKQPEAEEHESNAPKPRKRSAKSQKSLVESHVGDSSSSTTELLHHLEKGSSEGCVDRPKRHAAPTNLKEPKCNLKMRRN